MRKYTTNFSSSGFPLSGNAESSSCEDAETSAQWNRDKKKRNRSVEPFFHVPRDGLRELRLATAVHDVGDSAIHVADKDYPEKDDCAAPYAVDRVDGYDQHAQTEADEDGCNQHVCLMVTIPQWVLRDLVLRRVPPHGEEGSDAE